MSQLDLNTVVGEWIAQRPHTARVFETLQVDVCLGRGTSLQQACWDRQLTPQDVLAQLHEIVAADNNESDQSQTIVRPR